MPTIRRFYDYTVTQTVSATSCAVDVPDDEELIGQGFVTPEARDARRLEVVRETLSANLPFAHSVAKTGGVAVALTDVKEGRDWREEVYL